MRKARIEKLTQEEIHQQRDDKSYKTKTLNQNNQMNKSKDDDNKIEKKVYMMCEFQVIPPLYRIKNKSIKRL